MDEENELNGSYNDCTNVDADDDTDMDARGNEHHAYHSYRPNKSFQHVVTCTICNGRHCTRVVHLAMAIF